MPTEKTIKLLQYLQEHPEKADGVNWDRVKADSPDLKMDVVYRRFNIKQPETMPTAKPVAPESFATTPEPASTAVVPMTQKKVGTLEPEDPISAWAVLRNLGRSIGRLADPKTLSEGSRELLDQIGQADPFTSKGRRKLDEIITQFGEPLRDWVRVLTFYGSPGRIVPALPPESVKTSMRNIGIDPLAGPATAGMVYGGASGLSRLVGKLPKVGLRPLAEGEIPVTVKPKAKAPTAPVKEPAGAFQLRAKRAAKEPWEMTKKEFANQHPEMVELPSEQITRELWKKIIAEHERTVKAAYIKGKPVPAEVLADYPDLAKPKAPPMVAKKKVGKLTAEQEAGIAALDDIAADLYKQKETALPTQQKAIDAQIRDVGRQKQRLIEAEVTTAEAGRVYVPVKEVRVATDKTLKALDLRTTPEEATIKEIDFTRRGDIAEADVRAGFTKREIQRVIPDLKRRELITQARENPKLRGELSEIERGVLNEIGRFYDEGFKKANEADVINSAVENYINHVWETADPKRKVFSGRYITTKTPFAKERKIPTIEAGKKMGLKPVTEDPAELMEIWARSVHRAIANKRAIDALKIIEAEDARLLIQPSTSAPSDYAFYDHPALRQYRWRGKAGKGAIYQTGVKVHPSIARAIDVAFGQNWHPRGKTAQAVFNAYTALDQAAKKSILTISLFHWHALTESAIATGQSPLAFIRGAAKLANNEELIVRAKRAQLGLGGTPDVVRKALRFKRIPVLQKTIGKGVEQWDKALWDNLHPGHKIEAFDRITRESLTNKKYSHLKPAQIDRVVAEFVNDGFGGLDWEGLGVTAKQQWLLQRSLLAPDWTLSQIRVFKGMFRWGEKGSPRRLSGELYRAYWRRAVQYNLAGANALNYVFTAWKAGDSRKGHFMIQNAPGHRFQLELPYNGDDGKPRWILVGKQFMEPFRYIEDVAMGTPFRTITGKIGPTNRIIMANITNQKWFMGPSLYQRKDPALTKYLRAAGYTAESVVPIPAQQWLGVAKGFKDLWDAAISSFGFPVKRDYGKKKRLRP